MKCPNCEEDCDRDEVDIGVGIQYGPWRCLTCGWSEEADQDACLAALSAKEMSPGASTKPTGRE